ncbi:unnamed protein product [Moneuplotes crassus]|uniref:Uncharacterized protein n=1 Tax=Euplotes crassus TaxID=5936 RepID=A0AAD1XTC0_EUPCR|nr:unnamed protein product [Moneuplotes crassus]
MSSLSFMFSSACALIPLMLSVKVLMSSFRSALSSSLLMPSSWSQTWSKSGFWSKEEVLDFGPEAIFTSSSTSSLINCGGVLSNSECIDLIANSKEDCCVQFVNEGCLTWKFFPIYWWPTFAFKIWMIGFCIGYLAGSITKTQRFPLEAEIFNGTSISASSPFLGLVLVFLYVPTTSLTAYCLNISCLFICNY